MKRESTTLFALFVLAIALLAWRGCAPRLVPPSNADVESPVAAVIADAGKAGAEALPVAASGRRTALAPARSASPSLVPPLRARRLDDYADSRDLQQLIDSLLAAAEAGDGEAAGLIARAYDECSFAIIRAKTGRRMRIDPGTLVEPQRSVAAAQAATSEQRCRGLIAQSTRHEVGWAMERIKAFMAKARSGGDVAQLVLSTDMATLELSSAEDSGLLRRIVASGHDEAVAMLALSLVDASGERDIQGPFSGTATESTAWMLVSCDLGRDCEPNGRLVREKCLMYGQCIAGSYRDYIRYFMATPHQYEEALKKERQILDLLARDALDELFPLRPKKG